jgi:hypothetical protein
MVRFLNLDLILTVLSQKNFFTITSSFLFQIPKEKHKNSQNFGLFTAQIGGNPAF